MPISSIAPGAVPAKRTGISHRIALLVLFVLIMALGLHGVSLARPLFIVGSLAIAVLAIRRGTAQHIEVAVTLFIVAPLLRRVVDSGCGYEPSGVMLTGPLLAILVPLGELRSLLLRGTAFPSKLLPFMLAATTMGLVSLQTLAQGDATGALVSVLKWGAPLSYGMWLFLRAKQDSTLVLAMTRPLLLLIPIASVYGVFQYIDPPDWDRYWMISSKMNSIGDPVPFGIRVFSTMNSPETFATFATCGLLLAGLCMRSWQAAVMALPCSFGLLLTLYRTAWLELLIGLLFCSLLRVSRMRAIGIFVVLALAGTVVVTTTPFGDVIAARMASLSSGTEDGSAHERLAEYSVLYNRAEQTLIGEGFGNQEANAMAIDGQIVACWVQMGLVLGLACLAALIWAGLQGVVQAVRAADQRQAVLGALLIGQLLQLPMAGVATGELGFLFWSMVGLASAGVSQSGRRLL